MTLATHTASAAPALRLTFAVTIRTTDGASCLMMTARSETDALRRAVKAGHNVQSVRKANVRAGDAPRPAVKAPATPKLPAPAKAPAPRHTAPWLTDAQRQANRDAADRKRAADAAFEAEFATLLADEARENAARAERVYWLTGEGTRPALPAPAESTAAGTPRHQITARNRPGVGAPFVGEGSMVGTGRHVRVAHEYVTARESAPVWSPKAPATL